MGAALKYLPTDERAEREDTTVIIAGQRYDLASLERRMDQRLYNEAIEFAGYGATAQAVVDEYARLHRARYHVPFIFGA